MRLCLMVEGQEDVSWEQWCALADACEAGGLEGLFRSDHYLSTIGADDRGTLDAWTTLAGLAARTERIRLGTLVSPVTFRHPAVLAKSAVTVDHISGGRVELGIGAGWNEREHAAYGFPFPDLRVRMEMLAEQVEIVHRLWTDTHVGFEGLHYRLEDCTALPRPLQRPRPPLILGGVAGPRSVALAVRFADEYNTIFATADEVRERRARVLEGCRRVGRAPTTLRFSLMTAALIGRDRSEIHELARLALRRFDDPDGDPDALLERRADTWITGTPEEAVARLQELEKLGVERVYLQHLAHEAVEMVSLVGAEVAPAVS
jgi:F420-dependent oxidoreductase-like protein